MNHLLISFIHLLFSWLQGKQTLFAYSCRRSFCKICMVLSAFSCCGWCFDCCNELRSIHFSALLPWSFSWQHLFCSPIPHEEISSGSISYNCDGRILVLSPQRFSFTLFRPKLYQLGTETNFCSKIRNFLLRSLFLLEDSLWWYKKDISEFYL